MSKFKLAAAFAGGALLAGCMNVDTGSNVTDRTYYGTAIDNPEAGAKVKLVQKNGGPRHLVDVPQRNASGANMDMCQVDTDISNNSRSTLWGNVRSTQSGPDYSRTACCNIDQSFQFAVDGKIFTLNTNEPNWCRDSSNDGGSVSETPDTTPDTQPEPEPEPEDTTGYEYDELGGVDRDNNPIP